MYTIRPQNTALFPDGVSWELMERRRKTKISEKSPKSHITIYKA